MQKAPEPPMLAQKRALRRKAQKAVKSSVNQNWEKAAENIFSLDEYKAAETVAAFMPTANEPQIAGLLGQILQSGKTLCMPKCAETGVMHFYKITSLNELTAQSFGIYEPPQTAEKLEPGEIDFVLMPCVCCGENGMRLGHGGGYYDRYFENSAAFKAVVCFDETLFANVPGNDLDVKPNAAVTQTRLIRF